jgi:hypothetical protein
MRWLCKILGHNWEMTFPFENDPLRWKFVCSRCRISQWIQPNLKGAEWKS